MTRHSVLSPSGATKWMNCPASLWLEKGIPQHKSYAAEEGTVAHALAEWCLLTGNSPESKEGEILIADSPPVDEEMIEHVKGYVTDIKDIKDNCLNSTIYVEEKLEFTHLLHDKSLPAYGTSDVIIIGNKDMHVCDFKYGRGVKVLIHNNMQLRIYALAAYEMFKLAHDIENIFIHIFQPRIGNYHGIEKISLTELKQFSRLLKDRSKQALKTYIKGAKEDDYNPGETQCRWCRAKPRCPALANYAFKTTGLTPLDTSNDKMMTNNHLAECYKSVNLIESWLKSIKDEVYSVLIDGGKIPGYKLVEGKQGIRKWNNEEDAASFIKSLGKSKDEVYNIKVISPTQAKKLCGKLLSNNDIEAMTIRSESNPVIAEVSDKREEWTKEKSTGLTKI